MARKELAELRRDRNLVGLLIFAPLFQLLVLGFAATTDIREIALAVRDNDHSWHSRELFRALGASGYFKTFGVSGPESGDGDLLAAGKAGLVLCIPPGFGESLVKNQPVAMQALVDGADSNFGVQGLSYLQKAIRDFGARLAQGAPQGPMTVFESRVWHNPGLVSRVFMTPAIMALLLMVTTLMVTSMALVREREAGTMEQLIVTPLRPGEIIIGKLMPFVIIGIIELLFALLVIRFVFQVHMRGSLAALLVCAAFFLLSNLGLGVFVSTRVKSQQQAMLVSVFFLMMPFMLLSGFAFPVENMPSVIQPISAFIPLTHFLVAVRGIYLKGLALPDLVPQALLLLGWGLAILAVAVMCFRKRLD